MADRSTPVIATATPAATDTVVGVQGGLMKRFSAQELVNAAAAAVTPTGGTMAITGALSTTGDITSSAGNLSASSLGTQLSMTRTGVATDTMRVGGSKELIVAVDGTDRASFTTAGFEVIGTASVSGDTITIATAKTPANAGATGTTGMLAWDASYVYVCTAANTWKRSAISTW